MATVDLKEELRREALRNEREGLHDLVDERSAGQETPQEMHERVTAEDAAEEALDVLESLRALQTGELVTWTIHRVAGPNGEPLRSGASEFVGVLGSTQLTQENIASQWGGGRYRVRGRYADGKLAGGRTINIAGDAKRAEAVATQNPSGAFNMQEFLAMMQAQESRRQEVEDRRRAQEKAERKELLMLLAPSLVTLVTAIVGRPAPAQTDLPALITALRPTVNPPDPMNSMKGMLEMLGLMKDVVSDGGGSETAEILKSVTGLAGPVLTAMAGARNPAPVPPRISAPTPPGAPLRVQPGPPPVSTVAAPIPPQPVVLPMDRPSSIQPNLAMAPGVDLSAPSQPTTQNEAQMFAELKPQVDALVQIAEGGADPTIVADTFFEQQMLAFNDQAYGQFAEFLENPKCLERIAIFNRGVTTHAAFFETLRARLIQRIQEESGLAQAAIAKPANT